MFRATLGHGIIFETYATLRADDRGEKVSRVRLIMKWLGSDFDVGVILAASNPMQDTGLIAAMVDRKGAYLIRPL